MRLMVRDVMNPDPVTATTRTRFTDLTALVAGRRIAAVPILGQGGEVVGVVTHAGLLKNQGPARWSRATGICAGEIMTDPVTIGPEAMVEEAARLMDRHRCGCLPVVEPSGKLAGTVSSGDLLRVFLRPDSEIRDEVAREVLAFSAAGVPGAMTVEVISGVVSVSGTVRYRSMLPVVLTVIRAVVGVVDVGGALSYVTDDTRAPGDRDDFSGFDVTLGGLRRVHREHGHTT